MRPKQYLLDAGPLAALFHDRPGAVTLMLPWLHRHEAVTSIVVDGEVIEYLRVRPNFPVHADGLRRFLVEVRPLTLAYPIMERYADLRLRMRRPHGSGLIGDIDPLIAATALEHSVTVVTTDRDFLRVPDLKVLLLDRTSLTVVNRP